MDIIVKIYLNPYSHYAVLGAFVIYAIIFHQYRIVRFLNRHNIPLTFIDRLALFHFPFWNPRNKIEANTLSCARSLANQFFLACSIYLLFYIVGSIAVLYKLWK